MMTCFFGLATDCQHTFVSEEETDQLEKGADQLEKKADKRIRTPTRVNKIQIGMSFNCNELLQFLGKEPSFFICLCFYASKTN